MWNNEVILKGEFVLQTNRKRNNLKASFNSSLIKY